MADLPTGSGSNAATASGQTGGTRRIDPLVGTVLAERYRILEILGRGGMGVVYKARHEFMDRFVALKMLLPQLVIDDSSRKRFQQEAKAAGSINHPNIIGLHDFGFTHDGLPYLVMDYLEGCNLSDLIKRDGQLGVQRTVTIFLQICEALAHAHRMGVIHRDLKPGNIMLVNQDDDSNFVKVVDFGVAKMCEADGEDIQSLTQTGELFGSPVYMSPEQCHGDKLDARSDVYSLGCVLYETLTGKLPLVGKNAVETIAKHMNSMPQSLADARPDLYIPDWMEAIVFKAMAKDPAKRHQTMMEFHDELVLGFTSTCSSSQLQALPPRVLGNSMSSIKIRSLEAGTSSTQVRALERQAGPSTASRVLWLLAAFVLLLGGGALAFNTLIKTPQPHVHITEPPLPLEPNEHSTKAAPTTEKTSAHQQATSKSVSSNSEEQSSAKPHPQPVVLKKSVAHIKSPKPVPLSKPAKTDEQPTVSHDTTPSSSLPVSNKKHHLSGDQYFFNFASKEKHFGDPVAIPGVN